MGHRKIVTIPPFKLKIKPPGLTFLATYLIEHARSIITTYFFVLAASLSLVNAKRCTHWIHPFHNYVIWPGSLDLLNREPVALSLLLMKVRLPGQNSILEVLIEIVYWFTNYKQKSIHDVIIEKVHVTRCFVNYLQLTIVDSLFN